MLFKFITSLLVFCIYLTAHKSFSQCTFTASNGSYSVIVNVNAVEVIPDRDPCTSGYVFNLKIDYNISFTGNPPGVDMYDLYGTAFCGSSSIYFPLPKSSSPSSGSTYTVNEWTNNTDCSTVTPTSLGCNTSTVTAQWVNLPTTNCNSSLPIVLADFEGYAYIQNQVLLKWVTSSEYNFSHFEIERAENEELNFVKVGEVKSRGSMEKMTYYQFVDKEQFVGRKYFRLKSVDLDGTFTYSRTIAINSEDLTTTSVYPNPVDEQKFKIRFKNNISPRVKLTLMDQVGRIVFETEVSSDESDIVLPETVNSGFYTLNAFDGIKRETIKLTVH